MAEFKRSYDETSDVDESEEIGGTMTEGTHLGTGFVGGLIVGGLAGWAFSKDRNNGYAGYPIAPVSVSDSGTYTQADVDNMIATKDAQYAQLSATQQSEFNTINRIDTLGVNLAQGLSSLGYENARLANANQVQTMTSTGAVQSAVQEASAKADLCCCKTQGLINQQAATTQGLISNIVPQMQNFYLADEVEKLRIQAVKTENVYQFGALASQLSGVGTVVNDIYKKVSSSST